ncbi:Hypothetical protein CINCED_3A020287 [Cinara cedri]|uniref:Uncharacterized protein n=1 Tax=Cinara cedri TaxID=506608 RepID=A0A5E4NEH1_9HEMI|nr:Hypothetical protein CINCED_3A020287 [Cinara cedri]
MPGLTLKKVCGEKVCPEYYTCLEHDLQCYPCLSYCNQTSNNYDVKICEEKCQDALQELEGLKTLIICMTVLVAIAIVLIGITLALIWKRERRIRKIKSNNQDSFFKKKLASLQYLKKKDRVITVSEVVTEKNEATNNGTSLAATQTDLTATSASSSAGQRTNSSSAGGGSNSSSGSSNKLPCEDATLEFSGYDNFGLKVSPILRKPVAVVGTDLMTQYSP